MNTKGMKAMGRRNIADKYESVEDKCTFEYLKIIKNVYTKETSKNNKPLAKLSKKKRTKWDI